MCFNILFSHSGSQKVFKCMTNITFYLFFFSTVPVGETLNMTVNISFKIQKSNYLYLGKGSPVIRLIKLRKGEGGSGTCYHEVPECKENYGLRHSGHKTITITIKEVTKLMEGFYRLYLYCVGFYHHCTTDQLLKSFKLIITGKL